VLLVLLIACANAASLLLARGAGRVQEIAVRVSLGATLGRLLRQFLAESLLLALLGGAGGVALAVAATGALSWLAPQDLPRAESIQVDWTVVAFTLGVSLATSLVFGLAPALQARRVDPARALSHGTRAVGGSALHRARTLLLVGEIALAFTLAATAGLLVRSLRALDSVSLGYEAGHRLVMYAHAPARGHDEYVQVTRGFDDLLDELRRVPGVVSAAAVMGLPGGQYGSNGSYAVEGRHVFGPGRNLPEADFALASAGYFQAMSIPLVRGRDFNRQDQDDAPHVAIVSEALARESFPGEDPIGHRIVCGLDDPKPMTVVGVVGDVRGRSPAVPPGPLLYMPLHQHPYHANEVQVVLRTALPPEALVESVRRLGQARNPEMAMRFTTLERTLGDSVATPRFRTALFLAFGALALALGVAGVYGLMSYVVTERHTELGVRMALGARPADVIGLMLGHAARVAAGGLVLGIAAAAAAARLASGFLFEVKPLDPMSFAAAALALLAMALLGAAVPAWRAGRVDPVEAIRRE
jgi:putative ABC transport system permease protein